jgi:tetratricopeptide (TPR) repeat protein
MDQHFNLDEIQLLCFDLGIDYEHLAGETKPKKIHELILMVVRNGLLPDLLELLVEERPNVPWPELPPDFDPAPIEPQTSVEGPAIGQVQSVGGDQVGGDKITVGDVAGTAIAIGTGATVVAEGGSLNVQSYQISGDVAGDVNIAGDVHITAEELPIPSPPAPVQLPSVEGFVGRESELAHFSETLRTAHLAVISGMVGLGKTTLAAVLAQQVAQAENIFWHTFHQGEGVETVIWKLAGFLARSGQDDLWQLLQRTRLTRGNLPPTETLLDYALQLLGNRDFLLCFDDLDLVDSDPQVNLLVGRVRTSVLAGELSLIITSRHLPEYVTSVETAFMPGLTIEAIQQMLHNHGVELSSELVVKLHDRTQGNAELLNLSIEMLRHSQYPERLLDNLAEAQDVERFLMNGIDAHLSEFEPEVMTAISVLNLFGHMGTRYAIAAILEGQNVRRVLRDLSDRFLVIEHRHEEGSEYGQHALVQAFYYDGLSRRQRQALHRLAGDYYQVEEPEPMRAAIHFERAGDAQNALQLVTDNVWELINLGHGPGLLDLLERFRPQQLEPAERLQVKMARGQVYAFLGESEEAQACYQEVLSQLAAQPDTAAVRVQRARAFRGLGELLQQESPQEALSWLRRGLAEDVALDALEEAGLHIAMGTIHMWLGSYEVAAPALENGLSLLPDGPSQLRATALENLGVVAVEHEGNVEKGIALTQESLQVSQQMRDHFKTAEILTTLGSYHYNSGDWPTATAEFHQALALAEQIGSKKAVAYSAITVGTVLIDQGDDEEAERQLENGLHLAQETNQLVDACICLLSLAELKLRQKQWEKAEDFLHQAEQLNEQIEDQLNMPIILRGYAFVKQASGELDQALNDAQRSVDLARENGEAIELGISLRVLGQITYTLEREQEALELFEQSSSILNGAYPYELARTQTQWGEALLAGNEKESGLALLEKAQATFQRLGARRDMEPIEAHLNA